MKRILSLMLLLLTLLSTSVMADNKKVIKSVDLVLDLDRLRPNMLLSDAETLALKEANTAYGDLAKAGVITVQSISWDGEFGEDKEGYPTLKPGYTYQAFIQICINPDSEYTTAYHQHKNGDYLLDPKDFSGSINGKAVQMRQYCAPYFPTFEFTATVPGGKKNADGTLKKEDLFDDYVANKKRSRSLPSAITPQEADELWWKKNAFPTIRITDDGSFRKLLGEPVVTSEGNSYEDMKELWVTSVIVDLDNTVKQTYFDYSDLIEGAATQYSGLDNLREIWLSNKVDAVKFIQDLNSAIVDKLFPKARNYNGESSKMFTADATLYVPEKYTQAVLKALTMDPTEPVYTVRFYAGTDVDAAIKAGKSATKVLPCTKHKFTQKMEAADRICQYPRCPNIPARYYYSCAICGKCERNKAHTFQTMQGFHPMELDLATDQAYAGVNAAGEHIYFRSCIYCGMSDNYHQLHLTAYDLKMAGVDGSLTDYQVLTKQNLEARIREVRLYTTPQPQMFAMPKKSTAKMNVWAQDGVNRALCDNLIDESLFGNDYTQPIDRNQLTSVTTLLVKEMTGKDASAEAIGLTDAALPKNGAVTRQELAAYIYRALRYIEQHSSYAYSDYDSRLSKFTDNAQVKDWAKEAVDFTTALEIIDPKTKTTLAPGETCSIELALVTAERSIYAHKTGWYQVKARGEEDSRICDAGKKENIIIGSSTFTHGDRFWVHRMQNDIEDKYDQKLAIDEPYTGFRCYVSNKFFHPIRSKVDKSNKNSKGKNSGSAKSSSNNDSKKSGKKKSSGKNIVKKGLGFLKSLM